MSSKQRRPPPTITQFLPPAYTSRHSSTKHLPSLPSALTCLPSSLPSKQLVPLPPALPLCSLEGSEEITACQEDRANNNNTSNNNRNIPR